MAVRFLKSTTASRLNRTLRPSGYTFPAGLNALPLTVDYLVVAGGGGGTTDNAGGGGAGGFRTSSGYDLTASTSYTVTVGGGGPASSSPSNGVKGSNSVFHKIGRAHV